MRSVYWKILLAVSLVMPALLNAQKFNWVDTVGSAFGNDAVRSIATNANRTVAGIEFGSRFHFNGTTFNALGGKDIGLYAIDSNNQANWSTAQIFRSKGSNDFLNEVTYDASSNRYYVAGQLDDSVSITSFSITYNRSYNTNGGFFVARFEANGAMVWMTPTHNSESRAISVVTDNLGDVYVLGEFANSITLRNSPLVHYSDSGLGDAFLVKYNANGVYQWSKHIYSKRKVEGVAVRYDATNNNIVLTGNYSDTIYFDNSSSRLGLIQKNKSDVFVMRYTTTGGVVANNPARVVESTDDVFVRDMDIDNSGNAIYTGGFVSNFKSLTGSSISSNGASDIFVVKTTNTNGLTFSSGFGGGSAEYGSSVKTSTSGDHFVFGTYSSAQISFPGGSTISTSSAEDIFLLAINNSGFIGAKGGIMTQSSDRAHSFGLDIFQNSLYISGRYRWIASFGKLGNYPSRNPGLYEGFVSQVKLTSVVCDFKTDLLVGGLPQSSVNICEGSDTILVSPNDTATYDFQWFRDGVQLTGQTDSFIVVDTSGRYSVFMSIPSKSCTETSDTTDFILDTVPAVSIVADTFCLIPGFNNITLNPTFTLGFSSISSTAGGVVGLPPRYQPSSSGVGSDTVVYTFRNFLGCQNSDTGIFVVNSLPQIRVNNVLDYCQDDEPDTLRFDTSLLYKSYDSIRYFMTPSYGIVSDSVFVPDTLSPTIHRITYEVVDTNGCQSDTVVNVRINATPNVGFNLSPSQTCVNSLSFTLNGAFPTGGIYSGAGIIDSTNGRYLPDTVPSGKSLDTISYTIVNAAGCTSMVSQVMRIDTVPVVDQVMPIKICESDSLLSLNGGIPKPFFSRERSGYIGSPFINSNNDFAPQQAGPGKHEVNYWFTNLFGCSDTTKGDSITVNTAPTVTLPDLGEHCENDVPFTLSGGTPSGGEYTYKGVVLGNDIFDPGAINVTKNIPDSVFYTFQDTATSCVSSAGNVILVWERPRLIYPELPFSPICNNAAEIDLNVMGDTLNSPPPANGGKFVHGTDTINRIIPSTYLAIGDSGSVTEELKYTFTDTATGCSDTKSQFFTVNGSPTARIGGISEACIGLGGDLTAIGGILYQWNTGDSSKSITIIIDTATTYRVTVTDFVGCIDSTSRTVELTQGNYFKAKSDSTTLQKGGETFLDILERNYPSDTIDQIGEFLVLTNPTNAYEFRSDPGIRGDVNSNFYYRPLEEFRRVDSIQYKMCDATCPNICDSAWVKFRVLGDPYEFMPNGFTPNGDGINDFWVVPGIEAYPDNELYIYNRWGDLIFQATPYANDWEGQTSTGLQVGGQKVVDGTYFYVLKMGSSEPLKGTIELKTR